MNRRATIVVLMFALLAPASAGADETPKGAIVAKPSSAKVFPYEAGIVDLLVTGAAARSLYDALPGQGQEQACGAIGLHKGDGKMSCAKTGDDYACHIWLDVKAQALALPETDDC
ncbi:hypothetical protein [Sphingomonas montanisoli]|uniref:Uncharacterized protein n=1 Tax=Sphingomonas montanisoli TaxID=2606412 RepID=A0A5D9CDL6_9SPHN|nr:hypothetical protein [Sphingomonas montanisoli]TZG29446.1 hypothetical protein FYJ91_04800 [Sphingomonas montanisoli]